jgi:multidrug efflux pump subunit AcrA (membrane-fusion protein)
VSGFIVLVGLDTYTVTVDIPEANAASIADGQGASVTLEAQSGVSMNGTVTSVSPISTTVSNVVEYPVTVTLKNTASGLKPGETASVEIIVAEADDALYVPSSAVTTRGTTNTVTVLKSNKQTTVDVTTGIIGTSDTQIKSGLVQGDKVVLSSGSSTSTSSGFPGGGGFGGGGIGAGIG